MNAQRSFFRAFAIIATSGSISAADFSVVHQEIASGGGRSVSSRFEIVSSINSITTAGAGASTSFANRRGYIGQLNEYPVAAPAQFAGRPGRPLKMLKSALLANDTDADDALLRFVSVPPTSANGIPLSIIGDWILYDAVGHANNLADRFTYLVTDGIDQSIGTVFLANTISEEITLNIDLVFQGGDNLLRVFGIPGRVYQIQTTGSLASPINWSNLGTAEIAPPNGLIQRMDIAPPGTRFYRAIEP